MNVPIAMDQCFYSSCHSGGELEQSNRMGETSSSRCKAKHRSLVLMIIGRSAIRYGLRRFHLYLRRKRFSQPQSTGGSVLIAIGCRFDATFNRMSIRSSFLSFNIRDTERVERAYADSPLVEYRQPFQALRTTHCEPREQLHLNLEPPIQAILVPLIDRNQCSSIEWTKKIKPGRGVSRRKTRRSKPIQIENLLFTSGQHFRHQIRVCPGYKSIKRRPQTD